jgi:hypothetical protein
MRYRLFSVSCMVAIAVMGAAPAYAGTDHGVSCGSGAATSTPGNAATSPGSNFNEPGTNSINGGKGNQAYSSAGKGGAGAPAQYDVACGNAAAHGTGTPMQTTAPTGDITNNARATRAISHTGNGATK